MIMRVCEGVSIARKIVGKERIGVGDVLTSGLNILYTSSLYVQVVAVVSCVVNVFGPALLSGNSFLGKQDWVRTINSSRAAEWPHFELVLSRWIIYIRILIY